MNILEAHQVDGKTVYIGISERTAMNSIDFLQNILGNDYKIIPLKIKPKFLYLDVVFTIINPNLTLVYRNGLEEYSYQLLDKYSKIEVSKQELRKFGFNVITLDLT